MLRSNVITGIPLSYTFFIVGVSAAASLGATMIMSKPFSTKYSISAICLALSSSAERISTITLSREITSRLISSFILVRQSSWLHCDIPILYIRFSLQLARSTIAIILMHSNSRKKAVFICISCCVWFIFHKCIKNPLKIGYLI